MKKAQVLSVIALAFALGVVAPVAGVISTDASAVSRIADVEKMSAADYTAALNKVAGQDAYKAYDALITAVNNADYADVNETTEITALQDLIADVKTGYTTASTKLAEVMYDAVNTANYAQYAALYNAVSAKEPTIAAIQNAVNSLNSKLAEADRFNWEEEITDKKIDTVKGVITAVTDTTNGVKDYATYSALVAGVNAAQEKIDNEAAGLKALQGAYTKLVGMKLSDAKLTDVENATIAQLKSNTFTGTVKRYAAWGTLINAVNDGIKADKTNEITNATNFNNLETLVAAAYGIADLTIADLPAVSGTGDGTNKPDDEKDPSAPDTGILSNTEASASTTLAMVAGIATALTAAGAGVVAYRNARRANK